MAWGNVVRLRLARFGRKNLPFYRIFAANSRGAKRDGKHLEILGTYDPIANKVRHAPGGGWCGVRVGGGGMLRRLR